MILGSSLLLDFFLDEEENTNASNVIGQSKPSPKQATQSTSATATSASATAASASTSNDVTSSMNSLKSLINPELVKSMHPNQYFLVIEI